MLTTCALAALGRVQAQSGARTHIGVLSDGKDDSSELLWRAFRTRLRELGYLEGKSIEITWRFSDGVQSRLAPLAMELVALKPRVIVTVATPATQAAMKETNTIPILFINASEPVATGLVASLARPGGNVTGTTNMSGALAGKWLELLTEIDPKARRFAYLGQPRNRGYAATLQLMQDAAKRFGGSVRGLDGTSAREVEQSFERIRAEKVQALIVAPSPSIFPQRKQIVDLAARHKLATLYTREEFVAAGGLMSYSPDRTASYRRAAEYVQRILQGARPGDLPVEEPSKFTLLMNLRTARETGVEIPQSLRMRADRLIE